MKTDGLSAGVFPTRLPVISWSKSTTIQHHTRQFRMLRSAIATLCAVFFAAVLCAPVPTLSNSLVDGQAQLDDQLDKENDEIKTADPSISALRRTKQTARKSTSGKAPRKQLATRGGPHEEMAAEQKEDENETTDPSISAVGCV